MYDSILARSFSKHEQKRLGCGATFCCLIIALFFLTFFKPYLGPIPDLNLQLSVGNVGLKMLSLKATKSSQQMIVKSAFRQKVKEAARKKNEPLVFCNKAAPKTEFCEIKSEARVDANSSSVFVVSKIKQHIWVNGYASLSTVVRPYARKEDSEAMRQVRKWEIHSKSAKDHYSEIPKCTRKHSVPAVLFSLGGYVGNNFHDFTDVVIPLFITTRHYNGEVQFLITDSRFYFLAKFQKLLKGLSNYEPIKIDKEDRRVHCFPSITIGLKRHPNEMRIDPEKHSTSMKEFREFLRETYSLNRPTAIAIKDNLRATKPRLLILSRRKTRVFTNIREIVAMARSLGYKVTVAEAGSNLEGFAETVNSCDVLMGVHGAGLANIVFLPERAVFIQIIPIGGLEWLAENDFEMPSRDMNLSYLDYKISKEESSLIEKYPIDHTVFNDPYSIQRQGWENFMSIYMDHQNVNVNVTRFKPTLVKALRLLRHQSQRGNK